MILSDTVVIDVAYMLSVTLSFGTLSSESGPTNSLQVLGYLCISKNYH